VRAGARENGGTPAWGCVPACLCAAPYDARGWHVRMSCDAHSGSMGVCERAPMHAGWIRPCVHACVCACEHCACERVLARACILGLSTTPGARWGCGCTRTPARLPAPAAHTHTATALGEGRTLCTLQHTAARQQRTRSPTAQLPCFTASCAYSTWNRRPCGLHVVTSVSYWFLNILTVL